MSQLNKWRWFALAAFVIILDQVSKYLASLYLFPYEPVNILPIMNLTLAYNTGAAFSFLVHAGSWHKWLFAGISILVSIALSGWILKTSEKDRMQLAGMSLILGGALGNLIDRIMLGHVIDFIDLYYSKYHWPIFNIADTAICIGAFLLIIDLFLQRRTAG